MCMYTYEMNLVMQLKDKIEVGFVAGKFLCKREKKKTSVITSNSLNKCLEVLHALVGLRA